MGRATDADRNTQGDPPGRAARRGDADDRGQDAQARPRGGRRRRARARPPTSPTRPTSRRARRSRPTPPRSGPRPTSSSRCGPADGRRTATAHEADLLKEGGAAHRLHLARRRTRSSSSGSAKRKATVLAMDAVPRITRAQKMDALVGDGEHRRVPRGHRGGAAPRALLRRADDGRRARAAGARCSSSAPASPGWRRSPRRRRWARIVRAFDTRPAVREQVESLGATFVEFKFERSRARARAATRRR